MHPAVYFLLFLGLCSSSCALYSASSPVVDLTESNFEAKVKSSGFYLVEFYAPWCGHCKALQPEYEKTAKALKGMLAVGAVNADEHKSLAGEYGIKGFPTIKLLYVDGGKIKSSDYTGGRTAKEMIQFALDKAKSLAFKRIGEKPSSSGGGSAGQKSGSGGSGGATDSFYSGTDVLVLSDGNFQDEVINSPDMLLIEFYAPWCGHCKNLKPVWIESATQLKGKFKIAAIDCTANEGICGQFGVRGYPTIKFFGKNKHSPEDYNGGRDTGSIVQFATEHWAKSAPPPEVKELVDDHVFEQQCTGYGDEVAAKQLCFIAFLPDILDSKASGRNAYIKTMKKVAEKFKDRPFSWLWSSAGQQAALENNFGVGGFGYPALVAYKPKDGKFAIPKGAFDQTQIQEFIERLRKGGESVASIQGSLAPITTVQPWDGNDAKIEEVDEFSLEDLDDDSEKKEL
jgi:protein disulfide-isomerase A6